MYRSSDGGTWKTAGLRLNAKNAVLMETHFPIPTRILAKGAQCHFPRYTILTRDNLPTETDFKTATILLQGPLTPGLSHWTQTTTG